MAIEKNKDKWIEEVLGSTQGMAKADVTAGFYERVTGAMNRPYSVRGVTLPVKQWAVAAVLLVAVNIASVLYYTQHHRPSGAGEDILVSQMVSESSYNY